MSKSYAVIFCLAILLCFGSCDTATSLDPQQDVSFLKIFGGPYDQEGTDLIHLEDGGFALLGTASAPELAFGERNTEVYFVRTDKFGNEKRTAYFGRKDNDRGVKIIAGEGDGFLLLGSSEDMNLNIHVMLVKVNADGHEIEKHYYGAPGTDYIPTDIIPTRDGGFVITGTTTDVDRGKPAFNPETDSSDIFLLKIDATGNQVWPSIRKFGRIGADLGSSVLQLEDGSFLVLGSVDEGQKGDPRTDFLLIRADEASGQAIDAKTYNISRRDLAVDLLALSNGDFLIAGNLPAFSVSLVRLDSKLDTVGTKQLSFPGGLTCSSLTEMAGGEWLLCGTTRGNLSSFQNRTEAYLAKLDGMGEKIWEQTYGGTGNDRNAAAIELPDAKLAFTGQLNFELNTMMTLFKVLPDGELDQ